MIIPGTGPRCNQEVAVVICIPIDEVHFEEIRFRGEPYRGLRCGTRQPSHLVEPHCDGSVTMDRNRDIDILGDSKAGSCVRFEDRRDGAK